MFSQNREDEIVSQYFGESYTGTLLEIGANDGVTFSNSLHLINCGWSAYLFEPASVCNELFQLHKGNPNVFVYNKAMFVQDTECLLMESGAHVKGGTDKALVSSLSHSDTIRWRNMGVDFEDKYIKGIKWDTFLSDSKCTHFDFISIDVEGYELPILQQIDLNAVACSCLCIEWNSKPELLQAYTDYVMPFGLKEIHRNAENLIYAR